MARITQKEEKAIKEAEREKVFKETENLSDAEVVALHKANPPIYEFLVEKPTMKESRAEATDHARSEIYYEVYNARFSKQAEAIREVLNGTPYEELLSEQGRAAIQAQFKDVSDLWGGGIVSSSLRDCIEQRYTAMVEKGVEASLEKLRQSTADSSVEQIEARAIDAESAAAEYTRLNGHTAQPGIILHTVTGPTKYLKFPTVEAASDCAALGTLYAERYNARLQKRTGDAVTIDAKLPALQPKIHDALEALAEKCGRRVINQIKSSLNQTHSYELSAQGDLQLKTSEMWGIFGRTTEEKAKLIGEMFVELNLATPKQIETLFSQVAFEEPRENLRKPKSIKAIVEAGAASGSGHSLALPKNKDRLSAILDGEDHGMGSDDMDRGEGNGWERFVPRGGNGGLGF
ncbi:MAG: hypothetical protein V4735_05490 [Pseudomonadota bacterium]